jgi:hypothetical protein
MTASDAIGTTLILIGQLRTYDPVILQSATGYPLRFLSSLVWTLLREEAWLDPFNFEELADLASRGDDVALDGVVGWLLEQIWDQDSRDLLDLEVEWCECTGLPVGS